MTYDYPEHLTIGETVDQFRIGRTRLYELIGSGEIEAIKLGRRTLVRTASLHEFFAGLPTVGRGDNK
ncbi:helix-turn-helix domain-containing protein [Qipengyuania sp. 1XM1-15A]|uniref:helix-turn-helix domain-containing protein n=1 Tax=Qipengyuania xiamenensis TaxID=2867237 RepID=UPI001C879508|nr:helix-turn-helix domain-containing protein [Qipengyuania xiamenensis]MBX7532643.1 helix-turn-helix domain-containing protein [Qipengyuania xiamenensis]